MADEVTLDDVARKSGVSRAAASRALNGRNGVSDEVRERVALVAKALDYRPNRAAKNLAGGRASVIGLVLGSDEIRTDIYAASLVQSVAAAADHFDEGLMLLMDSKNPSRSVQKLLSDGLVDGVIVSAVAIGERWLEQLLDAQVPTILVGSHPRRSDVNVIDVENVESAATIVGRLLDSGCKRVATITGPLDRVDAALRREGYRRAHQRRGLTVDPALEFAGTFARSSGYEQADAVLETEPDAIFSANDEMAVGILYRMGERGLQTPDDISIAGFDGTADTGPNGPQLTSVAQPFDQLALTAVQSLVALVHGQPVPLEQLITPTIVVGDTTRSIDLKSLED